MLKGFSLILLWPATCVSRRFWSRPPARGGHQVAGSGAPAAKADGGNTRFEFKTGTGRYNVWANDSGDIVKSERTDKLEKETREFSNVKYNSNPHVDF